MVYLSAIIEHIERRYDCILQDIYLDNYLVDGIKFLMKEDLDKEALEEHILYIGDFSTFHTIYAKAMIILINAPVHTQSDIYLTVGEEIDIIAFRNTIEEIIIQFHKNKAKYDCLLDALYSGNGIIHLINTAHHIIENPITICDTSFSILHATTQDDTLYLDSIGERRFLKEIFVTDMHEKQIIDRIYDYKSPFIAENLLSSDKMWLFEGVRIKNSVVAYICIRANVRPFREEDYDMIHAFSKMLSIEMQKDRIYNSKIGQRHETFLNELLEGHIERKDYLTNQLYQLGHKPAPCYRILVCRFEDGIPKRSGIRYHIDQLKQILPNSMSVMFKDKIVVLVPFYQGNTLPEMQKQRLSTFMQLNKIMIGISYAFDDIAQSTFYFHQVNDILNNDEYIRISEGFIKYEDNVLSHITSFVHNKDLLRASIHPHIVSLLKFDVDHHTDYANTLYTYIKVNRNALLASKKLHIHKSTFFYRLSKIEELFGVDIHDGTHMFAYEYSLALVKTIHC